MSTPRSVKRLLMPLVVVFLATTAICGIVGTGAAVLTVRSMVVIADEVRPAARANDRVLIDLLDAETSVRGWSLMGGEEQVEPYRRSQARLPRDLAVLEEFARDRPELARRVVELREAADTWRRRYAEPRLDRPGGRAGFDADLFLVGYEAFEDFRAVHAELAAELERIVAEARRDFRRTMTVGIGLLLIVVVLSGLLSLLIGTRAIRRITQPLDALESTVQELIADGVGVRAEVAGPREVQAVAKAVNVFAAERDHSREVEHRVWQELRSLDRVKDDFVSNVSHELRTPLTSIAGYLEMLADELDDRIDPSERRMLETIQRNADRLRTLIEDLLTLSRTEASSTSLEQIDLAQLVSEVVTDLRVSADQHAITLVPEPIADQWVLADRLQLARAFSNVIVNAIKFSTEGNDVEIKMVRTGDVVEVQVVDHGIGIPADELKNVGNRFFRASNAVAGEVSGTGLGLRIVHTIVNHHGGSIRLSSVEGEGTTVTITLPAVTPVCE